MDIRIVNTKNRIQGGLINVLGENPLYEVKDKEIIEAAQISAASYYKYYSDKSAVLKDLENTLFKEYKEALSDDTKSWLTLNHGPNKKEVASRIKSGINELVSYFFKRQDIILALISKNGDPAFRFNLIDLTSHIIRRMIFRYFQVYGQSGRLKGKEFELGILSQRFACSFLGSLFIGIRHSDRMSSNDVKQLIIDTILKSPYDVSTHDLNN